MRVVGSGGCNVKGPDRERSPDLGSMGSIRPWLMFPAFLAPSDRSSRCMLRSCATRASVSIPYRCICGNQLNEIDKAQKGENRQ